MLGFPFRISTVLQRTNPPVPRKNDTKAFYLQTHRDSILKHIFKENSLKLSL